MCGRMKTYSRSKDVDILLCEALPERYACQLCGKLVNDPVQTYRGNVACQSCYKQAKSNDGLCPIDHEPIKPHEIFKDKAKAKDILSLKCYCGNKEYGCEWIGEIAQLKRHYTICEYSLITCEFCEMEHRKSEQNEHFRQCSGLMRTGECPLESVGCTYKATTIEDMKKHFQEDNIAHMVLQSKCIRTLTTKNKEQENQAVLSTSSHSNNQNALEVAAVQAETDIKNLQLQIEDLLKSQQQQQRFIQLFQKQMTESLQTLSIQDKHNTQKPSKSTESVVTTNALVSYKKEIEEVSNTISTISTNVTDIDLRQQLYENTTFDGCLMWKIDNYKHRRHNAVIGKVTALHSAPCFTSRYGYKFCGRLYLNGDGMGKTIHISLYVVIMKSEYDNLLEWPFQKRFSFTLINQTDPRKNITEKFNPGRNSSSFQQPTKEMNIASGCPLFASIEMVENEGFIKKDSMFIEIKVEDM